MKTKTAEDADTKTLTKSVSALQRHTRLAAPAAAPASALSASLTQGQSCSKSKAAGLALTPRQRSKQSWEKQWPTYLPVVSSEGLHLACEMRSRWRCARRKGRKGMVLLTFAQQGTEMRP